jgi:dsRNA-specific ribonuclease
MDKVSEKQIKRIHKTIEKILTKYVMIEDDNDFITSQVINNITNEEIEGVPDFTLGFIHSSVDLVENYEKAEFLGDSVLALFAARYLVSMENEVPFSYYTRIKSTMVSNMNNGVYAVKLGLDKHIIHDDIDIGNSIYSDVFEAFLGLLFLRSERVTGGRSSIVCGRFLENLVKEDFDAIVEAAEKDDVTFVDQVMRTTKAIKEIKTEEGNKTKYEVQLTSEGKKILGKYGTQESRTIESSLGTGKDKSPDEAKKKAYKETRKTLTSVGIDENWSNIYALKKIEADLVDSRESTKYATIIRSLRRKGASYINITFPSKWKADTSKYGSTGYLVTSVVVKDGKIVSENKLSVGKIKITSETTKKQRYEMVLKEYYKKLVARMNK